MMRTIKGPAIFLAQFAGDAAPYNTLSGLAHWAAGHGYKGVQIPSWDGRLFDLQARRREPDLLRRGAGHAAPTPGSRSPNCPPICRASWSPCIRPMTRAFDGFAAPEVRGNPAARHRMGGPAAEATRRRPRRNLGLTAHATFSGALAWPYIYPWPQRPAGLVETAFDELARRWTPILDAFDEAGVDVCYEIHPGEDLHDGVSFEMFLERVGNHPRCQPAVRSRATSCCSSSTISHYIDIYHERIRAFHVKDAEFNPTGEAGRLWRLPALGEPRRAVPLARATGRSISAASSPSSTQYGFDGWAVLEWECCIKDSEQGAAEGAPFIAEPHHPGDQPRVRRFRRQRRRRRRQPQACWGSAEHGRSKAAAAAPSRAGCGSAWSAAGAAPSSAPCIASPRGSTTATSWWPARCPPIRQRAHASARRRCTSRPTAATPTFAEMAQRGGRAAGRHRRGGDRHAEPSASRARRGVPATPAST